MNYQHPLQVTCARCGGRYIATICHYCKLGQNGRDYK
jgi:hypothetical protein